MPDYKSMYYCLFNRVSDAITVLQAAQQEGEESAMSNNNEPVLLPVDSESDNDSK